MICEKKKVFLSYQIQDKKKRLYFFPSTALKIWFEFFHFFPRSFSNSLDVSCLLTFQFFRLSFSLCHFFYIFNTSSSSRFIFIRIFDGVNFRYFVWKSTKKSEQIEKRWVSMGWAVGSMNQFYDVHFRQVGRKTHTALCVCTQTFLTLF